MKIWGALLGSCISFSPVWAGNVISTEPFNFTVPAQPAYETYAVLTPIHETQLSSEIEAQVKFFHFLPGEHFQKGDVLIEFYCEAINIQVKRLLAIAQATEAKFRSNLELKKMNSVSELEIKNAQSEHIKATTDVELMKLRQNKCKIMASYEGDVISKYGNNDENVKVDDPLLDIISNQDLEVQMYVPSQWLALLAPGVSFKLKLNELKTKTVLQGSITKIVGKVDAASQSVLVFGHLNLPEDNTQKVYAGMSGQAQFELQPDKANDE